MQAAGYWLLCTFIVGCTPIAPEVRTFEKLPHGIDAPIYVTAARQKNEIVRSLRDAGFHVVDRLEDSQDFLRVTIGATQGTRDCGTLHNVRYQLRFRERTVVEAVAKGWIGSCEPNLFDAVSRELRHRLVEISVK